MLALERWVASILVRKEKEKARARWEPVQVKQPVEDSINTLAGKEKEKAKAKWGLVRVKQLVADSINILEKAKEKGRAKWERVQVKQLVEDLISILERAKEKARARWAQPVPVQADSREEWPKVPGAAEKGVILVSRSAGKVLAAGPDKPGPVWPEPAAVVARVAVSAKANTARAKGLVECKGPGLRLERVAKLVVVRVAAEASTSSNKSNPISSCSSSRNNNNSSSRAVRRSENPRTSERRLRRQDAGKIQYSQVRSRSIGRSDSCKWVEPVEAPASVAV